MGIECLSHEYRVSERRRTPSTRRVGKGGSGLLRGNRTGRTQSACNPRCARRKRQSKASGLCGERERPGAAGLDGGNRLVERWLAGVAAFRQCWKGHERTRPCARGSRMGTPKRFRRPAGKLYDCVLSIEETAPETE